MGFYSSDGVKRAQEPETVRFIRDQDSGQLADCEKMNSELRSQREIHFFGPFEMPDLRSL